MKKNIAFVVILAVFAILYVALNYDIPILRNIGLVGFILVVFSQIIKL